MRGQNVDKVGYHEVKTLRREVTERKDVERKGH